MDDGFHFKLDYLYYKSYQGDGHKSGAYAFRPDESEAKAVPYSLFNKGNLYEGKLVTVVELSSTQTTTWWRWLLNGE